MVLINPNDQRIIIICTIIGTALGILEFTRRTLTKHRQEFKEDVKEIVEDEITEIRNRQKGLLEHLRRIDREVVRLRDWLKKILYERGQSRG